MLGEDALAAIVAAVGNHEGKALTYLAMDPDEDYGKSALHRLLFEAVQGETPALVGGLNNQSKYVEHSFAPVGLAEIWANEKGWRRYGKLDPGGLASDIGKQVGDPLPINTNDARIVLSDRYPALIPEDTDSPDATISLYRLVQ